MRSLLLLPLLLAGCGTGAVGNRADEAVATAVQTATLTGLYEGGGGSQRSQLCIVEHATGDSRFGLVHRGAGDASCSGAGSAVRQDSVLRLTMEGDEPCVVEAAIEGGRVTFPAAAAPGCAYYCGAGANLAGAVFEKVGGTSQDAARARDLVGDPLCG
ncbi:MAG: hypothetical protein M3177_02000 [Pseudomonadota bacterium]|nr:hypothetical protein [Pseudomonadota bacterium]